MSTYVDDYYNEIPFNDYTDWSGSQYAPTTLPSQYQPSSGGYVSYASPSSGYPAEQLGSIGGSQSVAEAARSYAPSSYSSPFVGTIFGHHPSNFTSSRSSISIRNRPQHEIPSKPLPPSYPTLSLPEYTAPEYNKKAISELQQTMARPGWNRLSNALTEALIRSQSEDNPYVRKTYNRSALRGYGEGLSNIMERTLPMAQSEYAREHAALVDEAKTNFENLSRSALMNYQSEINRQNAMYEAAWKDYLSALAGI